MFMCRYLSIGNCINKMIIQQGMEGPNKDEFRMSDGNLLYSVTPIEKMFFYNYQTWVQGDLDFDWSEMNNYAFEILIFLDIYEGTKLLNI